ncbi:MAG: hybrid, partial [Symbiobacteriaceae bacterium]|nr:hybrid [Symbiobacteriaceae bacterium]
LLLTGGDKLHIYPPAGLPFQLVNCYGPTESTVVATAGMVPVEAGQQAAPSIGQPIANTRAYLLDHQHQPVPIGVTGELYVGGSSLARGYLNRPDLTAERFVETPFGRLYRTGDLACRLPDGALAFMGRSDDQVKIRGFRIELGEIETTLKLAEGVQAAAVIVREDQPGRRQLVAYVVPDEGRQVVSDALRSFLQKQLPDYMVPAAFVLLPALPLTPNGKVDRKALPAPEGGADANEYVAPRTPREEIMAGIWCEVLGVSRVGVHDSFFELGGHSLLATRLTSRIRTVFGAELPVRSLFAAPTVAGLVAQIEGAQQNQLPQVAPVPHEGPLPLSFAQQRLWFLDQLEPGSPFYNIPVAWRVTGRLELPVLERSLAELAAGHESLRTTFVSQDGKPVQVIHPATGVPVALTDLTALDPADREAELQRILRREAVRPFDLAAGPLLRVLLVRLSPDEHLLMCNVHHIIADGWSMGVLLQELTALYGAFAEGQPSPLAPLPVQYADFALWQRDCLEKGELQRQLAYWKTRMAGAPAVLELPTDRPRPAVQSFRGAVLPLKLPGSLAKRLGALSRQEGATLFMTLLASFQVLLARYSGQTDIVVGSPVAGRSRAELEGLIGFFVNTLLHRTDLSGAPTFRELLARVREGSLGALDHQDVAFQHLVEELQPQRTLSHAPLFQVMFSMESMPVGLHAQHGLTFAPFVVGHDTSKFDLTLSVQETDDGIVGALEYSTDLFDAATIERLAGHFATLLEGIAANPDAPVDALPLLTEAESHRLLTEWNATQRDYRTGLLISQLFEEQVARTPDAAALVCGRERISYRELNDRANRLAAYLRELGAGPDGLVGVCLDRTAEMVVALLGVLKAGGAYVPLDPAYPRERLAVIAEEAQVKLLLTRQQFAGLVTAPNARVVAIDTEWAEIAGRSGENAPSAALETNLAYVIYTSGSTGRPKGVAITHASAVTFIHWALETFAPRELAGVLFSTSICFDLSIFELFATLSAGGKVILAENLLELPLLPAAQEVTLINTVPSGMAELLRMKGVPAGVVTVNLAGEPLPNSLAQDVYGLGHIERVYNLYGPTEDTTYSTYTLVARGATQNPAIGRPVSGTQAYIVDGHFRPVPIGVPGELYLGGAGLARGYYGRPDLTAERFMPNPLSDEPGARIYRTGDLARWLPDGQIEYLGRIDDQVKVRGFRIELGEVQEALLTCPGVSEAVVVARQQSLAAYFSAARDLTVQELRAHLGRRLPAYMIPAAFVQLAQMPHLPNGKVDRKALPAPTRERAEQAAAADTSVTTVTPVEQRLAAIWQRLLGLEQVGTHENFFDLGGHSLLIIRLRSAVEEEMGVTLPVTEFFKHPTVASLAARLTETAPAAAPSRRRRPAADEAVAIIGMACRFPQSPTLARYWANLRDGRECLTEAPGRGGERFVALGGYLEDIDKFDAAFFGISPREAEWMDPQHRIFLETVWAAMEDAGYLPDAMEAPVSLYAGVGHTDYFQAQPAGGVSQAEDWHAVQASRPGAMTTRVSYKLNLTGESLLVDTACSTSLVAVHMACRSLLDGSADYALAGGAAVPVPHKTGYEYEPGFILSPDGRCRAFDQQAAGTTVGSGVGVVFLKRLSEAVRDRDPIYAVIRGSAINNDGKLKAGYTAPSEQGQLEVILAALDAAGVDPDSIGMVEGHGTATPLGDPIEVRALTRAYRHFTNRAGYCALGSVKSNIGHADSAAGVAGLIKAALALHHGQIPPSLHFTAPNPELDLPGSPFYVPAALQPWARNGTPRRAAVSAFGIGGTNAHVILEEAPGKEA